MALPQQVEAAAAAADELLSQMNAPQGETPGEEPTEAQVQEPTQEQPQEQPQAAPTAQTPPQVDPAEQRFRTLQGIMNKEIHTLQGQVKHLTDQLGTAVERLNQRPAEPKESRVAVVSDPKDVENFGVDLVDMVNRVAGTQHAELLRSIDERFALISQHMAGLSENVNGAAKHVAQSAEESFFAKLERTVPDWERTNQDQRFLAWLAEVDPVYGLPRQAALDQAQKQLSVERAAAVFNAFTGPRKSATTIDPLDKQVSPRGTASPAPTAQQARMVAASEITRFYDEVRRGEWRGKEDKAAQREAEFNLALSESRVR